MGAYRKWLRLFVLVLIAGSGCQKARKDISQEKIRVILDTDTNNELDDQHALAYLLFSGNVFGVEGVTVNATYSGGSIEEHYAEAQRIIQLCAADKRIHLLKGANGNFEAIEAKVDSSTFDGIEAVNFIIQRARVHDERPLILIAVGKLTNIALAVKKDPSITAHIRLVWLGSNYPEPGEYNQNNDTTAMNYLLNGDCPFEMVTVRYGKESGTDAVRATQREIDLRMPGKGPRSSFPIIGRHGSAFYSFGDYSVDLFGHIDYDDNPPSRALFDMAAVAVVKNPSWSATREIPCPILVKNQWIERPDNSRRITIREDFDRKNIMDDFYKTMEDYVLADSI
jgi:Inosine-uridine preferring nucleoside hydrolase